MGVKETTFALGTLLMTETCFTSEFGETKHPRWRVGAGQNFQASCVLKITPTASSNDSTTRSAELEHSNSR